MDAVALHLHDRVVARLAGLRRPAARALRRDQVAGDGLRARRFAFAIVCVVIIIIIIIIIDYT